MSQKEQIQAIIQEFKKVEGGQEFLLKMIEALREGSLDAALGGVPLDRATPQWEYRESSWSVQGPYLYLYWKENGKLRKRYLGLIDEQEYKARVEQFTSQSAQLGNFQKKRRKYNKQSNYWKSNISEVRREKNINCKKRREIKYCYQHLLRN
jgi:hypothetical protein